MQGAFQIRTGSDLSRYIELILIALMVIIILGLPLAVWLDLRFITISSLTRLAANLDTVITGIRGFYASDVVERVLAANGHVIVTDKYLAQPGGIPIPAKFSLELSQLINDEQASIKYRFISHYPFKGSKPHHFNAFENSALASLEQNPHQIITSATSQGLTSEVRYVTPILMQPACVACHNTNPNSPRHDWKEGDVRGIQELIVTQPITYNLSDFRYLLLYFAFVSALGISAIALERRQSKEIQIANNFLSSISQRISKYISPQIYRSIFSGKTDTAITTKRKKLTIFFSDIKNFTMISEQLQPEELTLLLNEYFTEMSSIAFSHGGTVDKYVGDALLIFFGDPESKGVAEDARACVLMAKEMQERLIKLNANWRNRGIQQSFDVRMGINTGFCNVGNFGSTERMDYTIIGAEVNLASRLQSIAEPGMIVMSYETYALVRDTINAHPLPPIHVKGITHEVVPYVMDNEVNTPYTRTIFTDHTHGLELYLDINAIEHPHKVRALLEAAIKALDKREKDKPE